MEALDLRVQGSGHWGEELFTFEAPVPVMRVSLDMMVPEDSKSISLKTMKQAPRLQPLYMEIGDL